MGMAGDFAIGQDHPALVARHFLEALRQIFVAADDEHIALAVLGIRHETISVVGLAALREQQGKPDDAEQDESDDGDGADPIARPIGEVALAARRTAAEGERAHHAAISTAPRLGSRSRAMARQRLKLGSMAEAGTPARRKSAFTTAPRSRMASAIVRTILSSISAAVSDSRSRWRAVRRILRVTESTARWAGVLRARVMPPPGPIPREACGFGASNSRCALQGRHSAPVVPGCAVQHSGDRRGTTRNY